MKSRHITVLQQAVYVVFMIYFAAHSMGRDQQSELKEQTDHLVPVNSHIEPAYMRLLSRRLFLSGANYARILVMPSTDEGEVAIAIYSRRTQKRGDDIAVTCTRAQKNLWYSMFQAQQTKANVPTVPVAQTDAPIPKSTAVAVSKAIEQMIERSRPPNHTVEMLDGTDIEFSVENKNGLLTGLLGPYAHGQQTRALHQLTKLLIHYCDAGSAERPQHAREIETQATRLLEMLKQER